MLHKIKVLLYTLLIACLSVSCDIINYDPWQNEYLGNDEHYHKVVFVNNSSDVVYMGYGVFYNNETLLTTDMVLRHGLQAIPPKGKYALLASIERDVRRYQFLIIKSSTFESLSKEELSNKNIYDALLEYSFDQLKAMNFIIEYK